MPVFVCFLKFANFCNSIEFKYLPACLYLVWVKSASTGSAVESSQVVKVGLVRRFRRASAQESATCRLGLFKLCSTKPAETNKRCISRSALISQQFLFFLQSKFCFRFVFLRLVSINGIEPTSGELYSRERNKLRPWRRFNFKFSRRSPEQAKKRTSGACTGSCSPPTNNSYSSDRNLLVCFT